jgi:hypothetical protein
MCAMPGPFQNGRTGLEMYAHYRVPHLNRRANKVKFLYACMLKFAPISRTRASTRLKPGDLAWDIYRVCGYGMCKCGHKVPSYILHTRAFGTYLLGGLFTLQKKL